MNLSNNNRRHNSEVLLLAISPFQGDLKLSQLSFPAGATLSASKGQEGRPWWYGRYGNYEGYFPPCYCKILDFTETQHENNTPPANACQQNAQRSYSNPPFINVCDDTDFGFDLANGAMGGTSNATTENATSTFESSTNPFSGEFVDAESYSSPVIEVDPSCNIIPFSSSKGDTNTSSERKKKSGVVLRIKKAGNALVIRVKKTGSAVGAGFKKSSSVVGHGFKKTGKAVARLFRKQNKRNEDLNKRKDDFNKTNCVPVREYKFDQERNLEDQAVAPPKASENANGSFQLDGHRFDQERNLEDQAVAPSKASEKANGSFQLDGHRLEKFDRDCDVTGSVIRIGAGHTAYSAVSGNLKEVKRALLVTGIAYAVRSGLRRNKPTEKSCA